MTAKHSPATSLPFGYRENAFITAKGHVFACPTYAHPKTPDDGLPESDVRQNFAYLVHAANAYPKLVAVADILASLIDDSGALIRPSMEEVNAARALLRELGEAE